MYALFIVLNKVDYLDEILAKFLDIGVRGATVLDSQGMAGVIAENDVPVFGFLKTILDDSKPYNKTIFTVLENQEMVDAVVESIKEILGDQTTAGAGFMFTVPIGNVYRLGE